MSEIGSTGSRQTNLVQDPGKRMFFRKLDFTATVSDSAPARRIPPHQGRWLPEAGQVALPGDVFWCVWQPEIAHADQTELVIAGDEGVILHRVQGQWRRYQTAERLPIHALYGRSDTDLYAVGWMGQVLHFDGADWQSLRGARRDESGKWQSCKENTPLFSICGNGAGQLWAVGDHGHILHFDGSDWHTQHSGTTAHLRAVVRLEPLAGDWLLAAGTDGTLLLGQCQSDQWRTIECGFNGSVQSLLPYAKGVLLAGGEYSARGNRFEGRLVHITLELAQDRYRVDRIDDLSVTLDAPRLRHLSQRTADGPVFIVGDGGYAALLKGHDITALGRVVQHDLLAGTYADDLGLVATGDFGTLLINDFAATAGTASAERSSRDAVRANAGEEPRWQRVAVPTRRQLWAVATDGCGRLCCCGDGGVVLRLVATGDATHWESMSAPTDDSLHCLVSDGHRGFYVAGQLGRIHHNDGERWSLVYDLQLDITITDFYSPSPDCIYAVGDEGLIVHWNGQQWQRMSSGTKSALYGIWGMDAEHVLAVGDFGLVLRWNGTDWREFHVGTESFLFGVWGDALDNIHVVGLSGTIGHFDGKCWQLTPARAREDLLGLCEFDGELFAVGVNGVVLRKRGTQWVREACETSHALRAVCASRAGLFAVGDQGQVVLRR